MIKERSTFGFPLTRLPVAFRLACLRVPDDLIRNKMDYDGRFIMKTS